MCKRLITSSGVRGPVQRQRVPVRIDGCMERSVRGNTQSRASGQRGENTSGRPLITRGQVSATRDKHGKAYHNGAAERMTGVVGARDTGERVIAGHGRGGSDQPTRPAARRACRSSARAGLELQQDIITNPALPTRQAPRTMAQADGTRAPQTAMAGGTAAPTAAPGPAPVAAETWRALQQGRVPQWSLDPRYDAMTQVAHDAHRLAAVAGTMSRDCEKVIRGVQQLAVHCDGNPDMSEIRAVIIDIQGPLRRATAHLNQAMDIANRAALESLGLMGRLQRPMAARQREESPHASRRRVRARNADTERANDITGADSAHHHEQSAD